MYIISGSVSVRSALYIHVRNQSTTFTDVGNMPSYLLSFIANNLWDMCGMEKTYSIHSEHAEWMPLLIHVENQIMTYNGQEYYQ